MWLKPTLALHRRLELSGPTATRRESGVQAVESVASRGLVVSMVTVAWVVWEGVKVGEASERVWGAEEATGAAAEVVGVVKVRMAEAAGVEAAG
jgi:hypothetical protein